MSKFIIGSNDLTSQINEKTSYKINSSKKYTSIEDANGIEYRNSYRTRVAGSFEMVFISGNDIQYGIEFSDFLELIGNNSANGVLTCTIYVQNEGASRVIDCYLDITIKKESDVNGYNIKIAKIDIKEC